MKGRTLEERDRADLRKLFTAVSLAGLCTAHGRIDIDEQTVNAIAKSAVRVADAAIEELAAGEGPGDG